MKSINETELAEMILKAQKIKEKEHTISQEEAAYLATKDVATEEASWQWARIINLLNTYCWDDIQQWALDND